MFCRPKQAKGEGEEKTDEKENEPEEAVEVEISPEKPSPTPAKPETPANRLPRRLWKWRFLKRAELKGYGGKIAEDNRI